MVSFAPLMILASLATFVVGHGNVVKPVARVLGTTTLNNCGSGAFTAMTKDLTAPVENLVRAADSSLNQDLCKLNFCRGAQFGDNLQNVYTFAPGQSVDFQVTIKVRHTGVANVSIVDTRSQTVIGTPLKNWPVYAVSGIPASSYPPDETNFSVTIPDNLGSTCASAGTCAIQWYWYGASQTYVNCVDFVTPNA